VILDLPVRHAPASLEARVLQELERRIALPWWRRGFAHWPLAARGAFVAICGAIIGFTVLDGSWSITGARALNEFWLASASWTHLAIAALASTVESLALLVHVIPPIWFYGGMTAGTLLYTALFGLGAAAYRTLYCQPSRADQQP
jgi:hypothetical protein